MYYDDDKNSGIEASRSTNVKIKSVYRGAKSVIKKGQKINRKIEDYTRNKALNKNKHSEFTDKKNIEKIKSGAKSITKLSGKSLVTGTIRVNGRLIENIYDRNDTTNVGANAVAGAVTNTNNVIRKTREVVKNVKTAYKVTKAAIKVTKKAVTALAKALSNPYVLLCVIFIIVIALSMNSSDDDDIITLLAGAGTNMIYTEDNTISNYVSLIRLQDSTLYQEFSKSQSYIEVKVNGEIKSSPKEIISILATIKEQEIEYNDENISLVKSIHRKFYKTTTKVEDKILIINIEKKSFDEVLEELHFTDDQKELAHNFLETNYDDIYKDFN